MCECDGWVCDRDTKGVPSIFKVMCSVATFHEQRNVVCYESIKWELKITYLLTWHTVILPYFILVSSRLWKKFLESVLRTTVAPHPLLSLLHVTRVPPFPSLLENVKETVCHVTKWQTVRRDDVIRNKRVWASDTQPTMTGVIQSKGTVKVCVGVKCTHFFFLGVNGTWLEQGMLGLGDYK